MASLRDVPPWCLIWGAQNRRHDGAIETLLLQRRADTLNFLTLFFMLVRDRNIFAWRIVQTYITSSSLTRAVVSEALARAIFLDDTFNNPWTLCECTQEQAAHLQHVGRALHDRTTPQQTATELLHMEWPVYLRAGFTIGSPRATTSVTSFLTEQLFVAHFLVRCIDAERPIVKTLIDDFEDRYRHPTHSYKFRDNYFREPNFDTVPWPSSDDDDW